MLSSNCACRQQPTKHQARTQGGSPNRPETERSQDRSESKNPAEQAR
ncbi:MAG: hypothetical protein AB8G95_14865 [Anaerolineae bacterium]